MCDRGQRGQFPVAEVACENQRRFAVEPQLREQFVRALLDFDAAVFWMGGVVLPDVIEMREFGADAAEIVPYAGEDGFDLLGRFFRKGRGEIGAADLVLAQPPANEARDASEKVRGLDRVEIARGAKQTGGQRANRG